MDVSVDAESITKVLRDEVIKRDALEGANAERASKRVNRVEAAMRAAKAVKGKQGIADAGSDLEPKAVEAAAEPDGAN